MDQNQLNELRLALINHKKARNNLLFVVAFSVINIILLLAKASLYFLFTAEFPYFLVELGLYMTNRLPGVTPVDGVILSDTFLYVLLAIALVIIIFYLCCWIFSKDRRSLWFILALVGFSLDTLFCLYTLIGNFDLSELLNLAFHVWVIVSLASGIKSANTLKKYSDIETFINNLQNLSEARNYQNPETDNEYGYTETPVNSYGSEALTDTQQHYRQVMAEYEAQKAASANQSQYEAQQATANQPESNAPSENSENDGTNV